MLGLPACTGLIAGPETSSVTPAPVSRDSAWVRARRAATAEAITIDVADSLKGRIVGTRYSDPKAKVGAATSCRLKLTLQVKGDPSRSELGSTSRWLASEQMGDTASKVCDKERTEVLARISQTVSPPPQ
ncbi:MAG TPA: hypothetical protein VF252_10515 [Gemmatimonadales bacterium]